MNVQKMTDTQNARIKEIKAAWIDEMEALFEKWDAKSKEYKGKIVLDRHLEEQIAIERKYEAMI